MVQNNNYTTYVKLASKYSFQGVYASLASFGLGVNDGVFRLITWTNYNNWVQRKYK